MPWTSNDRPRIIKYNAYSIDGNPITYSTLLQLIDRQMANLTDNAPEMIAIVQADLDLLDTLDESLTSEQGSSDAAIVELDVIRWSETKSKTAGIETRFATIRSRIARILSQSIGSDSCGGGWSSNSLMRG